MNAGRALGAGATATAVMTALWLVEPSIGLPRIAVGHMLSTAMSVSVAHWGPGAAGGWIVHLLVGMGLALVYAWAFAGRLHARPLVSGAIYGIAVFLLSELVFMPLVGAGLFARGDFELLAGSLLGNVVYGLVLGWIYGPPLPTALPAKRAG